MTVWQRARSTWCRIFGHRYGMPWHQPFTVQYGMRLVELLANVRRCRRCGYHKALLLLPSDPDFDLAGWLAEPAPSEERVN